MNMGCLQPVSQEGRRLQIGLTRHETAELYKAWTEQRVYTHEYFSQPVPYKAKDDRGRFYRDDLWICGLLPVCPTPSKMTGRPRAQRPPILGLGLKDIRSQGHRVLEP